MCIYVWCSILKASKEISEGQGFKICYGSSLFWHDDWIDQGLVCQKADFVYISDTPLKVRDVWQEGAWNLNM